MHRTNLHFGDNDLLDARSEDPKSLTISLDNYKKAAYNDQQHDI